MTRTRKSRKELPGHVLHQNLHPSNITKPIRVVVVGVGGTGSEVVSGLLHLHQALLALGRKGLHVIAFDPDTVSPANLVRQRYHEADLGRNKAEVLIRRINAAAGTTWKAFPTPFPEDMHLQNVDVLLSCVDTRSARATLHKAAFRVFSDAWKLWGDFGNEDHYGQVIFGEPRRSQIYVTNPPRLLCATEIHPELIDTRKPEENSPSCSALEALERQDLMVNKIVAQYGLHLLWKALQTGRMVQQGYYYDLESGIARAMPSQPTQQLPSPPKEVAPVKKAPVKKAPVKKAPAKKRDTASKATPQETPNSAKTPAKQKEEKPTAAAPAQAKTKSKKTVPASPPPAANTTTSKRQKRSTGTPASNSSAEQGRAVN